MINDDMVIPKITDNESLKDYPVYKEVEKIFEKMYRTGTFKRLSGQCLAAADLTQKLLSGVGIKSKIIECQLCIQKNDNSFLFFIGYDEVSFPGQIDTHVIVVTETDRPLIIDFSISQNLPPDRPCVVDELTSLDPEIIGVYNIQDWSLTYTPKKNLRLPHVSQRVILDSILREKNIFDKMRLMLIFLSMAISLSLFNFGFNSYILSMKFEEEDIRTEILRTLETIANDKK